MTHYEAEEIRETFWGIDPTDQPTREFAELLFRQYLENRWDRSAD